MSNLYLCEVILDYRTVDKNSNCHTATLHTKLHTKFEAYHPFEKQRVKMYVTLTTDHSGGNLSLIT